MHTSPAHVLRPVRAATCSCDNDEGDHHEKNNYTNNQHDHCATKAHCPGSHEFTTLVSFTFNRIETLVLHFCNVCKTFIVSLQSLLHGSCNVFHVRCKTCHFVFVVLACIKKCG